MDAGLSKFVQIMTLVDLDLFYDKVKFGHKLLFGKNENNIFSKTIAANDLKVGRCIGLSDLMNLQKYQRSKSSFDLRQRFLGFQT